MTMNKKQRRVAVGIALTTCMIIAGVVVACEIDINGNRMSVKEVVEALRDGRMGPGEIPIGRMPKNL